MLKGASGLFITLVVLTSLVGSAAFANPPSWYSEGMRRDGQVLMVPCSGDGSAPDLARRVALKSCIATAADQTATDFHVQSVSIQTESMVALHESVESDRSVTGLTCSPINETTEESDGAFKVYLLCTFDLNKAKVVTDTAPKSVSEPVTASPSLVISKDIPKRATDNAVEVGSYSLSDRRVLNLSVMPACDSVIAQGGVPRILKCTSNPMAVTVSPNDTALIVRATGFKPRTLKLNSNRSPAAAEESYELFLEH